MPVLQVIEGGAGARKTSTRRTPAQRRAALTAAVRELHRAVGMPDELADLVRDLAALNGDRIAELPGLIARARRLVSNIGG